MLIAKTRRTENNEVVVYYKQDGHYFLGNDRYEHGDYAVLRLERIYYERKREDWRE